MSKGKKNQGLIAAAVIGGLLLLSRRVTKPLIVAQWLALIDKAPTFLDVAQISDDARESWLKGDLNAQQYRQILDAISIRRYGRA